MKTASISMAKNQLSALIALVRKGETVIITDRDQPVAQLSPLSAEQLDEGSQLAELERSGLVRRSRVSASRGFLKKLPPMREKEADVLGALLADRDEGR
jgi:antitoxin (DNA-binding transcriptional repressor) of toxin-antitoxin stability system